MREHLLAGIAMGTAVSFLGRPRVATPRRDRMGLFSDRTAQRVYQLGQEANLVVYRGIRVRAPLDRYLATVDDAAAKMGGRITWTSGYRTAREQLDLVRRHEQGDPSVPFEPLPYADSAHSRGGAADGDISPASLAPALGAIAQRLGLIWNPKEPWHFEIPKGVA